MTKPLLPRTNYKNLQFYASEHFGAYEILKSGSKSDMDYIYIKYYLLCRSLELNFKGLLLQYNLSSVEDLSTKYRHNLSKLLEDIKSIPIIDIGTEEEVIIRTLNKYYNSKKFEYPERGSKNLPILDDVESLGERFIWFKR